jgi:hypothetical protein
MTHLRTCGRAKLQAPIVAARATLPRARRLRPRETSQRDGHHTARLRIYRHMDAHTTCRSASVRGHWAPLDIPFEHCQSRSPPAQRSATRTCRQSAGRVDQSKRQNAVTERALWSVVSRPTLVKRLVERSCRRTRRGLGALRECVAGRPITIHMEHPLQYFRARFDTRMFSALERGGRRAQARAGVQHAVRHAPECAPSPRSARTCRQVSALPDVRWRLSVAAAAASSRIERRGWRGRRGTNAICSSARERGVGVSRM